MFDLVRDTQLKVNFLHLWLFKLQIASVHKWLMFVGSHVDEQARYCAIGSSKEL